MDIGNILVDLGGYCFRGHAAAVRVDTAGTCLGLGPAVPDRVGGNSQTFAGHCNISEKCRGGSIDDQVAAVVDGVVEVTGFNCAGIRLSLGAANRNCDSFTDNASCDLRGSPLRLSVITS